MYNMDNLGFTEFLACLFVEIDHLLRRAFCQDLVVLDGWPNFLSHIELFFYSGRIALPGELPCT
jgi:hypothetical protein